MTDELDYDKLTESQKKKFAEITLSLGYRIEGTTDEEVKEYFTRRLKEDDELRKKLGMEKKD